jgi:S-adenosylmethionine:tRNA ribosyltransferase-isomerase
MIDQLAPETVYPGLAGINFRLPPELEASEPPEARGLERSQVRLMVSWVRGNRISHTDFRRLPDYLQPGDVLVLNTSGTMNAALPAVNEAGKTLELHLSTHLPADVWVVELRQPG